VLRSVVRISYGLLALRRAAAGRFFEEEIIMRRIGTVPVVFGLMVTALSFSARAAAGGPGRSSFPVYNVRDFGAVPDSSTLNTAAIQRAIDTAERDGGGMVYVPPGDYLTGSLKIGNNVTLYLEAGAVLWGSGNRKDYRYNSLIYAEDAVNPAIRGSGAIDGNGPAFWTRESGRWMPGEWRPSRLMQFVRCRNLLLEDITLRNSPSWTVHPVDCDGVVIRGISILNGIYEDDGPNTDGINPDGCSKVRISDCYIQAGDDCIVLKITKRPGGNKVCRDVTVTNCVLTTTETALKIGSESNGEFRNITFSNCAIHDAGCGIGLWMRDGGLIDGLTIDNISMDVTKLRNGGQPIYIWSYRRTDDTPWGTIRNVTISNMTAVGNGGISVSGVRETHIENLTLDNIRIFMRGRRETRWHADPPYPFTVWGHHRAPFDIFCRYVNNLRLRNVRFTWASPEKAEWGSAVRCWYVQDLEIDNFTGRQSSGSGKPVHTYMIAGLPRGPVLF